jgi:glycosyltransferase involved in cell wall biosynthesis
LDGYNETRSLGTAKNTIEALRRQDFPLDQVEVILAASAAQIKELRETYSCAAPFLVIKAVEVEEDHYYQLKNAGAQIASGEIIAFTDSDVYPQPTWLSSIVKNIKNGADVSVGLSLFKSSKGWDSGATLRQIAVSITFGYILGKMQNGQLPEVRGFMDHNIGLRAGTYHRYPYRTDQGRTCASPLLYRTLAQAGVKIFLQPEQRVVHYFSWGYWLSLHFRYGYEVFQLRRLDKDYPNQWIARTKIFEPLVTMVWHVLLNQPRWLRFSKLLRIGLVRRLALLPVVAALSVAANASEMAGIYATMLRPNAMKRWAESF